MRERDIEKILTEEVKREGGRAYKLDKPGERRCARPDCDFSEQETGVRGTENGEREFKSPAGCADDASSGFRTGGRGGLRSGRIESF